VKTSKPKIMAGMATSLLMIAAAAAYANDQPAEHVYLAIGKVSMGTVSHSTKYTGSVAYGQSWDLLSPTAGKLKSVQVMLGDVVESGALLAQMDTSVQLADEQIVRSRLTNVMPAQQSSLKSERSLIVAKQLKARLAIETKLKALARLKSEGIGGAGDRQAALAEQSELLLAQRAELTALDSKIAELRQQQIELSSTEKRSAQAQQAMRAPFKGTVTAISLDPTMGQMVAAGQHILTLIDDQMQILKVSVTEDQTAKLVHNRAARCTFPRRAVITSCKLVSLGREGDMFIARFSVDQRTELTRGEPGEVETIEPALVPGLKVPKSALRHRAGVLGVDVLRASGRKFVAVSIVATGRDEIIIDGLLKVGENVLVAG
jgi:multidrug efflux pump subunit AcrA (membrane-fusion protein)